MIFTTEITIVGTKARRELITMKGFCFVEGNTISVSYDKFTPFLDLTTKRSRIQKDYVIQIELEDYFDSYCSSYYDIIDNFEKKLFKLEETKSEIILTNHAKHSDFPYCESIYEYYTHFVSVHNKDYRGFAPSVTVNKIK